MKKLLVLLLILSMPSAMAVTCGDYSFTGTSTNYYCGEDNSFNYQFQKIAPCNFGEMASATIHLDYPTTMQLVNGVNNYNYFACDDGTDQPSYSYAFTCSSPGEYTINITLSGGATAFCQELVTTTVQYFAHLNVTMSAIDDVAVGETQQINITFTNDGNGNITAFELINFTQMWQGDVDFSLDNTSIILHNLSVGESINITRVITGIEISDTASELETTVTYYGHIGEYYSITFASNSFRITEAYVAPTISISEDLQSYTWQVNQTRNISILKSTDCESNENIFFCDGNSYDNDSTMRINVTKTGSEDIVVSFNHTTRNLTITIGSNISSLAFVTIIVNDTTNISDSANFTIRIGDGTPEECNGVDDDGNGLIDEYISNIEVHSENCQLESGIFQQQCIDGTWTDLYTCRISTSSSSGGSSITTLSGETVAVANTATVIIVSPVKDRYGLVQFHPGDNVFFQAVAGTSNCEWNFGNSDTLKGCSVRNAYTELGVYLVKLIYDDEAGNRKSESIQITIADCFTSNDCAQGEVCCGEGGTCVLPTTCSVSDCEQSSNPFILFTKFACEYDASCGVDCTYEKCDVECTKNSDCGISTDATQYTCRNSGTCEAICEETSLELFLSIEEPRNGAQFTDTRVEVILSTSQGASCSYSLNGASIHTVRRESFYISADWGRNSLDVWCDGRSGTQAKTVRFDVVTEDGVLPKNLAGEAYNNPLVPDQYYLPTVGEIKYVVGQILEFSKGVTVSPKESRSVPGSGKSDIVFSIHNENPIPVRNVILTEYIAKDLAQNASSITSLEPFAILEEDPVIEFTLPILRAFDDFEIKYTLPVEGVSASDIEQFIQSSQIIPNITEEDKEEFINQTIKTQDNIKIYKDKKEEDNKTTYTNKLKPQKVMEDVDIYLNIPKCMAEHLNDIEFKDTNFEIISEDPLIMWHLEEMDSEVDYEYVLDGLVDEDCENEASIIAVARIIKDQYVKDENADKAWLYVLLPLLMIPLVILGLLMIYHFNPTKEAHYYASFCRVDGGRSLPQFPHPADDIVAPKKPKL